MLLWSPTCHGAQRVVDELPELLEVVSGAGARLVIVNTDSSRVEAREALPDAVPEAQIVFATQVSKVLTNPMAYEDVEGPVLKAVVVPAFVVIDPEGIVRSSKMWDGVARVLTELERMGGGNWK